MSSQKFTYIWILNREAEAQMVIRWWDTGSNPANTNTDTEKEPPRLREHKHFHTPPSYNSQSQAQAQAQASDYICVLEFALNIYHCHISKITFLWCSSFFAFLTLHSLHFWEIGFFQTFYKIPLQSCANHRQVTSLAGDTSTFTSMLFWSLGVTCRRLAHGHMWDLPEMEIAWWSEVPEM